MIKFMSQALLRVKSERLDFETHLKYVILIEKLSNNLNIKSTYTPKLNKNDLIKLKDKIKLIKLTKKSIDQEYEIVQFDKDYSSASVLWLPIKTYYLIYHLLCVVEYLNTGKVSYLSIGHHECIDIFTKKLENAEMKFNEPLLNKTFDENILNFVTKSGEHLKTNVSDDIIFKLMMKKVANSKIDNYKIVNNLSGRRTKDKIRINNFKKNIKISIFDYFHTMRLRTNYRNFNFVDNVSSIDTKIYFEKYYSSGNNLYTSLTKHINELIKTISN